MASEQNPAGANVLSLAMIYFSERVNLLSLLQNLPNLSVKFALKLLISPVLVFIRSRSGV